MIAGLLETESSDIGRLGELEPIAIVDIGSNSVRLVVYEGAIRSATPIFNEKVSCGLGRGISSSGRLPSDAVEQAVEALKRFAEIARILAVKSIWAVATAAVRDAGNGAAFIRIAEEALGVKIQVLTGKREAELAAQGIMMGFAAPDGIAGDLGGGSLELIDVCDNRLNHADTLPLGGLRLIDEAKGRPGAAITFSEKAIGNVAWLDQKRRRTFYAVGGTWRALAKLHMTATRYPLRVTHGYRMSTADALALCDQIDTPKKLAVHRSVELIAKARREVLPYGAIVLASLLKRLKPADVVFSVFGIREGLLYSLLSEPERAKDPLLSYCLDIARLRSRSARHAVELCEWTDALFSGPGPAETPEERRLRHAACLVSDNAWRAHPDYRGEQSLNIIAHATVGGTDHPGRIFIALTVYFRHVGTGKIDQAPDELSARLTSLVSKRELKRARILGAAIRTAHMLSIGMPGVIDETPLSYHGDKLRLTLGPNYATLHGDRLRRRFSALASLLDRKPEIVTTG